MEASPKGSKFTRTSVFLFVFYFVLSANDGIVKSKSKSVKIEGQPGAFPYSLSSVMLMSCCVSLCTGIAIAVYHDGMEEGLRKCLDIDSIKRVAPINGLFQVAFVMKFEALRRLDPDIVSMLSQANLVLLALAARFIMGRRYKRRQWTYLVMTTLSMWLYLINRDGKHMLGQGPQFQPIQHITGYFIVITMCIIETVATVLAEAFLKYWQAPAKKPGSRTSKPKGDQGSSGSDAAAACGQSPAKAMHSEQSPQVLPFWVQKVHVEASGLFFMVMWIFVLPYFLHGPEWEWIVLHSRQIHDSGNVLAGWDRWTVAVLIMVIVKAWLAGLVSKLLDSVMKQIGSCLSILLTYLEVVIWLDPAGSRPTVSTLVALAMVLVSIIAFACEERQRSRPRRKGNQDWPGDYKSLSADPDTSRKKGLERLERLDSRLDSPGCDMRPFRSMRPLDGPHSETESTEPHAESLQRSRRYRSVHKTSSEDPERHGADGV